MHAAVTEVEKSDASLFLYSHSHY